MIKQSTGTGVNIRPWIGSLAMFLENLGDNPENTIDGLEDWIIFEILAANLVEAYKTRICNSQYGVSIPGNYFS